MTKTGSKIEAANKTVTDKLKSLYRLQLIDSEIDRIKIVRCW